MTGLELTALTNSIMAQSALFFACVLWLAPLVFPGLHPALVWAGRAFSVAPVAMFIHRWFWNNAIFFGAQSDIAWDRCDRASTPDKLEAACRYGGWFLDNSAHLFWPILLGAIGVVIGVRILGVSRGWALVTLLLVLQVPAALLSVWMA